MGPAGGGYRAVLPPWGSRADPRPCSRRLLGGPGPSPLPGVLCPRPCTGPCSPLTAPPQPPAAPASSPSGWTPSVPARRAAWLAGAGGRGRGVAGRGAVPIRAFVARPQPPPARPRRVVPTAKAQAARPVSGAASGWVLAAVHWLVWPPRAVGPEGLRGQAGARRMGPDGLGPPREARVSLLSRLGGKAGKQTRSSVR